MKTNFVTVFFFYIVIFYLFIQEPTGGVKAVKYIIKTHVITNTFIINRELNVSHAAYKC